MESRRFHQGTHPTRAIAIYFPALSAILHCPQIQVFRERLLDKGKTKMQVVGAVMHKLIRVVYGVLKSQQPFDPNLLLPKEVQHADKPTNLENLVLAFNNP